jgi:hypothetical protein
MVSHGSVPFSKLVVASIVVAVALPSAAPLVGATTPSGGIQQIVEIREEGRRCLGVVIELGMLAFTPSIDSTDIAIRDDKHNADLRSVVDWKVSPDGKRLTIRLKAKSSDFGSGNALRVCLERAAFRQGHQPSNDRECWMIGTDPL